VDVGLGQTNDGLDAPIVVLASGPRCGSTLLQRLLNSHPDVLVWGEGGGFLERLVPAVADLLDWAAAYDPQRQTFRERGPDAFTANLLPDDDELRAAAAAFVRMLYAEPAHRRGRRRWGFKETRCGAEVARFLRGVLPDIRVVHLTRDPGDVLRSLAEWEAGSPTWDAGMTAAALDDWTRVNASFLADPAAAHLALRYESMVADPEGTVAALAAALGLDAVGFDRRVFERRIQWDGEEGGDRPSYLGGRPLDADRAALRSRPPLPAVAAALGYGARLPAGSGAGDPGHVGGGDMNTGTEIRGGCPGLKPPG
jgi:hypothetical protein